MIPLDNLVYPRPGSRLSQEVSARPFVAAVEDTMSMPGSEEAIAEAATILVRNTLVYKSNASGQRRLSDDLQDLTQGTNCFGHTYTLSNILTDQGIRHSIGFANNHSFVVLGQLDQSPRLLDPQNPKLNGSLRSALVSSQIKNASDDIRKLGVGRLTLFSDRYLAAIPPQVDIRAKNPWLSHYQPFMLGTASERFASPEKQKRMHTLFMSVYTPEVGRMALLSYSNLNYALDQLLHDEVLLSAGQLEGKFPELDYRNRGASMLLESYIRQITSGKDEDNVSLAIAVVDSIATTLSQLGHIQSSAWPISQRVDIARRTKDAELAENALEMFDDLGHQANSQWAKRYILAKIKKTQNLLYQLRGRSND